MHNPKQMIGHNEKAHNGRSREREEISLKLRNYYKNQEYSNLQRFVTGQKYPISQAYVGLVIKVDTTVDKESSVNTVSGEEQVLQQVKKVVAVEDIFAPISGKTVKKVVVYGEAGSGKSTLCKRIVTEWGENKLWADNFEAVISLSLTKLISGYNPSSPLNMAQVVREQCFDDGLNLPSLSAIENYLTTHQEKILLVLDGYDEIAAEIDRHVGLKTLLCFWMRQNSMCVIITSRPVEITQIGGEPAKFDKRIESAGFTPDNIINYVEKFSQHHSQELLAFLRSHPSIWSLAHNPMHLDMLISIWKPEYIRRESYTKSWLYSEIKQRLIERYLLERKQIDVNTLLQEELVAKAKHLETTLEELALAGFTNNHSKLPAKLVQKVLSDLSHKLEGTNDLFAEVLQSGFVTTEGNFRFERDKNLAFLHTTFQEYYAAQAIVRGFIAFNGPEYYRAMKLLKEQKYLLQYELVWPFVAGMLYEHGRTYDNFLPLLKFWNIFESDPRELIGQRHAYLNIKLLDECAVDSTLPGLDVIHKQVNRWLKYSLGLTHMRIFSTLWDALASTAILKYHQSTYALLLEYMNNGASGAKYAATVLLERLGIDINKHTAFKKSAIQMLQHKKDYVRWGAYRVLERLAKLENDEYRLIIEMLKNQDAQIRRVAAAVLAESITPKEEALVMELLKYLEDPEFQVQAAIADIINKNAPKNNEKILKQLFSMLQSSDSNTVYLAMSILPNVIEKGNVECITHLSKVALQRRDEGTRVAATKTIGSIANPGDKATIDHLKTIFLLGNGDQVEIAAVEVLSSIANQGHSEVIELLNTWFNTRSGPVKEAIRIALSKISVMHNQSSDKQALEEASLLRSPHITSNYASSSIGRYMENPIKIEDLLKVIEQSNRTHKISALSTLHRLVGSKLASDLVPKIWAICTDTLIDADYNEDDGLVKAITDVMAKLVLKNYNELLSTAFFSERLVGIVGKNWPVLRLIQSYAYTNNKAWLYNIQEKHELFGPILICNGITLFYLEQKPVVLIQNKEQIIEVLKALQPALPGKFTSVINAYLGFDTLGLKVGQVISEEPSALHRASASGNLALVQIIITKGEVDIDEQRNDSKKTALMVAVQNGQWAVMKYLIEQGADINCYSVSPTGERKNAIDIITSMLDLEKRLRQKEQYQKIYELLLANYDTTKGVISGPMNADRVKQFMNAIRTDDRTAIKKLISADKTDLNNPIDMDNGTTALMYAVQERSLPVIEELLKAGADAKQLDECHRSAIDICSYNIVLSSDTRGIVEAANFLVEQRRPVKQTRLSKALDNAILCVNDNAKFGQILDDMLGSKDITEDINNSNLRIIYKMHLENITELRTDRQPIQSLGNDAPTLLRMRIYLYVRLLAYCFHDSLSDVVLPPIEGGKEVLLQKLRAEIATILETLHNEQVRNACDKCENSKVLAAFQAKNILSQLKSLPAGRDYSCHSGYIGVSKQRPGHSLYVSFTKYDDNNVIVRIDNRWVKTGRMDADKHADTPWMTQTTYSVPTENGTEQHTVQRIKPYLVGAVRLDDIKLLHYIESVLHAIALSQHDDIAAINAIYGTEFEKTSGVMEHADKWPDQDRQGGLTSNCTMSSHNFGVLVRNGEDFFRWTANWEKSVMWQELKPEATKYTHSFSGGMRGGFNDGLYTAESIYTATTSLNNAHNTTDLGGLVTTTYIGESTLQTNTSTIISSNSAHNELMKRFQNCLGVTWNEVYIGIAVEQALVNKARIITRQNGATFRPKDNSYTEFHLRFAERDELQQFVSYYNISFPGLIATVSSYQQGGFTAIEMNTSILYSQVAPSLTSVGIIATNTASTNYNGVSAVIHGSNSSNTSVGGNTTSVANTAIQRALASNTAAKNEQNPCIML
ncbi:MAG: NACHT domain-containing protein [Proteobacteria bacterium]|nr:NACHT domain-containing protein [Pseudomonadota bacterium]